MATITPGEVPNNDGASQKYSSTEPLCGDDTSRPTKKLRRAESLENGHVATSTRKQEKPCQLNLDVLFLVVKHGIEPMDLLNLAYTCKSLRGLLMGKMSAFVWKAARNNVCGLPECPRDLSEPEYANLAFCTDCHGCGKPVTSVLWEMRRRYCATCKRQRLCKLSFCKETIRNVLIGEFVTVKGETSTYVERSQMESLLFEYSRSCDKRQFMVERQAQKSAIETHAFRCDTWHKKKLQEQRAEIAKCRETRKNEIFYRLNKLGYDSEIYYFGARNIRDSYRTFFMFPKLLTDQEWDQAWPVLREIMEDIRLDRLEKSVYSSRRGLLADEYNAYLEQQTQGNPGSGLFPHVNDLGHFGPFQSIIKAPERTKVDRKSFMAAFQELPNLADEWRKELEGELAEVVKAALALPSSNNSVSQDQSSSITEHPEAVQADLDILHLACAVFFVEDQAGSYAYPDVFFAARCVRSSSLAVNGEMSQRTRSNLRKRFGIMVLKEASYVVRACGLDPSVATIDDMDHLNARLMCLSCKAQSNSIMNWRMAMWHAREHKRIRSQWKLVSDEHIDSIQAIERSVKKKVFDYTRCLLCRSRVGCFIWGENIRDHLSSKHNVKRNRVGVHYARVGIRDSPPKVEMVQGSVVTFRKSTLL